MSGSEERLGVSEGEETVRRPRPIRAASRKAVTDERISDERGYEDREATEDREVTDDERFELLLEEFDQSILPDLPLMHGYHICWLSTTNQRDTIQWRNRLGYELVTQDMCPGWGGAPGLQTGATDNYVRVNEMIAARIPLSRYNRLMQEFHARRPLLDEEKLRANIDAMSEKAEQFGARVIEGDGMTRIVQKARPMPTFTA